MDLQASVTYPTTINKLPSEEFSKDEKSDVWKSKYNGLSNSGDGLLRREEEVFQINAITEEKSPDFCSLNT